MKNKDNSTTKNTSQTIMTRKQAIKKAGGIAALTAASILFLATKSNAAGSMPAKPPTW